MKKEARKVKGEREGDNERDCVRVFQCNHKKKRNETAIKSHHTTPHHTTPHHTPYLPSAGASYGMGESHLLCTPLPAAEELIS